MRKNTVKKMTVLALCGALVLGEGGRPICALAAPEQGTAGGRVSGDKSAEDKASKDETVYVLTDAQGEVRRIIVSDWLKNPAGEEKLRDSSRLVDAENIKNDRGYVQEGDAWIWDTGGGDVYYQGDMDQEQPPVSLKVTYLLDGEETAPEELAGKSGKVTIRYDYVNNLYEYRQINGVRTKVYVPFALVTGVLLDNDVFSNVEVTNGRLVNDGDRTVVMGIAFPGLQENLGVDRDRFSVPDYVEITADAEDFSLGMTVAVAANQLFEEEDFDESELKEDLGGMLEELTDAMGRLTEGTDQLYDGLCTLLEKSGELVDGIDRLSAGASELETGAAALDQGAGQLQGGAARLQAGLNTLASKNGELVGGAEQIFGVLLSTAQSQLSAAGLSVPALTVENYGQVLTGIIASLDENSVYQKALEQVRAAVEQQRGNIEAQVTAAVREQVEAQVAAAIREQVEAQVTAAVRAQVREQVKREVLKAVLGMEPDAYEAAVESGAVDENVRAQVEKAVEDGVGEQMAGEAVQAMIQENIEAQMAGEQTRALLEQNVAAQMQTDQIRELVASNTEAQIEKAVSDNMASDAVQGQIAAAGEGLKAVASLKASLDSYNAFYQGLRAYTAGVSEAAGGAGELSSGIGELRSGTERLCAGTSALTGGIRAMQDAAPALTDGITRLRDGAGELSDGLKQFDEEVVGKLTEAVDGDLEGLLQRLHAVAEVSGNYNSFAGINDGMEGQVKFIYRIEAVEAEE